MLFRIEFFVYTITKAGTYYYRYDDTGQRIYKDASAVKEFYLRDASGNTLAVYDMNTNKIKLANIFGNSGMVGRVGVTWSGSTRTDTRYYYLKDHLGSTRLEFDRYANVSSAFAYYAYGSLSSSYNNSNPNDKYKFTGKERDTETNYDYFGARYYDSDLGHWMSVDPLAVKYPGLSPYNYTLGNPVRFVDPNGKEVKNGPIDYVVRLVVSRVARIFGFKAAGFNALLGRGFGNEGEDVDRDGIPDNIDEIDGRPPVDPKKTEEERKKESKEGSERLDKALDDAKKDNDNFYFNFNKKMKSDEPKKEIETPKTDKTKNLDQDRKNKAIKEKQKQII